MPRYIPLDQVARTLKVTLDRLEDFGARGWIRIIEKDEIRYLPVHEEYKARFILRLCEFHLTEDQIGTVLRCEDPPYSLADVPRILATSNGR